MAKVGAHDVEMTPGGGQHIARHSERPPVIEVPFDDVNPSANPSTGRKERPPLKSPFRSPFGHKLTKQTNADEEMDLHLLQHPSMTQKTEYLGTSCPLPTRKGKRKQLGKRARAPEQQLTKLATRLAVIEKASSLLCKLAFVGASVVILGGFASTINLRTFSVVTGIILAEGFRIFSRNYELAWKRSYDKWHLRSEEAPEKADPSHGTGQRRWSAKVLSTPLMVQILHSAQLFSAVSCLSLSVWGLIRQNFEAKKEEAEGEAQEIVKISEDYNANLTVSMNIFFIIDVIEAFLFLLEECYREYKMRWKNGNNDTIFAAVRKSVGLPETSCIIAQFFHDVYHKCLKGSVFEGLEMDLIGYGISWLQSEEYKQQLEGARVLNRLVSDDDSMQESEECTQQPEGAGIPNKPAFKDDRQSHDFAGYALRRLGTTPGFIERLVDMMSWSSSRDEPELLYETASIVSNLVNYSQNCSKFVAVAGATDGVFSLLMVREGETVAPRTPVKLREDLRLMGLRIFECLCKNPRNLVTIGGTRRLLSTLIYFIEVPGETSSFPRAEFEPSLRMMLLLVSATNTEGTQLRLRIANTVSALKNLRDVIKFADNWPELQLLAIEVLYHVALEKEVRENIGATGGVFRTLVDLFVQRPKVLAAPSGPEGPLAKTMREQKRKAGEKAGKALGRLVVQNEKNCIKLLHAFQPGPNHEYSVLVLFQFLDEPENIASSAADILAHVLHLADGTIKTEIAQRYGPPVLETLFMQGRFTKTEKYEADLGLGSRLVEVVDEGKYLSILHKLTKTEFLEHLFKNLHHTPSTNLFPRVRRYTVKLVLALIAKDDSFLDIFQRHNATILSWLDSTLDAISEVENFCLFSGHVGCAKFEDSMEDLLHKCISAVKGCLTRKSKSPISAYDTT